jgi:hypothetical protein
MIETLDMSAVECAIIIDRGGEYVSTWTLPGTGDLAGTVEIVVEAKGSDTNVCTFTGTIIDAPARKVRFTFASSITATLPTKELVYSCKHTLSGVTIIVAKGPFRVKGSAL